MSTLQSFMRLGYAQVWLALRPETSHARYQSEISASIKLRALRLKFLHFAPIYNKGADNGPSEAESFFSLPKPAVAGDKARSKHKRMSAAS